MQDFLEIYKKFDGIKELKDCIDEINNLRDYYYAKQFEAMARYINEITCKYPDDAGVWNTINPIPPETYDQAYINAENFLRTRGAVIIAKTITNYVQELLPDEVVLIKNALNLERHLPLCEKLK